MEILGYMRSGGYALQRQFWGSQSVKERESNERRI